MVTRMHQTSKRLGGAKRQRRKSAEWVEEVRAWRASGQSAGAYAEQHGLHAGTLAGWGTKLRDVAAEAGPVAARSRASSPMHFLPVRVSTSIDQEPALIELVLRNGRRVRVSGAFDGEVLARALTIAEGVTPC